MDKLKLMAMGSQGNGQEPSEWPQRENELKGKRWPIGIGSAFVLMITAL